MKHSPLLSLLLLPVLASAITLTEVVQKTIESHPQIQIKREVLSSEKELLTAVEAGYLPSIDLAYMVGPEATKTIANQRDQETLIHQEASITLTEHIFSGLSTVNGVKQQKALILSASDNVQESANSLALETVNAYIDLLKKKELLDISKENVAVHKKYLDQIGQKVEAGVGNRSDYKQTLSRYENARSVKELTEQNYINSISSFKRIYFGDETPADLEKPTVGSEISATMDEQVAIALQNNPTIHMSQDDIMVAQAALKRSDAAFYPSADIRLQAYWNKNVDGFSIHGDPPDYDDEANGYNALLILKYNIFNGMADLAQKQANQYRLLKQHSTLADAKSYITAYTQIAYQTFESTKKQLEYVEKNIKASAETLTDYQKEHELGRRSIIDLLNIELEYNTARNSKVTAEYDHILSYYQILSYSGKLLEQMNVVVKQ